MTDPSRRELLAGGAAAAAAAALVAPGVAAGRAASGGDGRAPGGAAGRPPAAGAGGDAAVLASLLRVEKLVVFAYEHALAGRLLASTSARRLATTFLGHEQAHVRALVADLAAVGGPVPAGPTGVAMFESELRRLRIARSQVAPRTERGQLRLLVELESAIARHYRYGISHLSDHRFLRTAAEIMACEAQHATAMREMLSPGNARRAVPLAFVGGVR